MSSRALGTFPCESIGKEQSKRLLVVSCTDKQSGARMQRIREEDHQRRSVYRPIGE
jgi:hypothetical protein